MTPMEPVTVLGSDGCVPLQDVFEGRRMLIVYHFMWKKKAPHHKQCGGCTHSQAAMSAAVCAYLAERDVTYAVFSSVQSKRLLSIGILWAGQRRGTRRLIRAIHSQLEMGAIFVAI
jgi:predicted dithiol-disulfide oxidoreductase (DUF899 family)